MGMKPITWKRDPRQSHEKCSERKPLDTAIKIELFDETIKIVCPPDEGSRFVQDEFCSVFDGWFPKTYIDNNDAWFVGHPLLESRL